MIGVCGRAAILGLSLGLLAVPGAARAQWWDDADEGWVEAPPVIVAPPRLPRGQAVYGPRGEVWIVEPERPDDPSDWDLPRRLRPPADVGPGRRAPLEAALPDDPALRPRVVPGLAPKPARRAPAFDAAAAAPVAKPRLVRPPASRDALAMAAEAIARPSSPKPAAKAPAVAQIALPVPRPNLEGMDFSAAQPPVEDRR